MGIRFIKFRLGSLDEFAGYHPALLLYGYLELCAGSQFIPKDKDGYFVRSAAQIQKELKYSRSTQERARQFLINKNWIDCRLSNRQSPTISYRICK